MKTVCEDPTAAMQQLWIPDGSSRGRCSWPVHCWALSAHRSASRGQGGLGKHLCRGSDGKESTGNGSRWSSPHHTCSAQTFQPSCWCIFFWTSGSLPRLTLSQSNTWPGVGTSGEGGVCSCDLRDGAPSTKCPEMSAELRVWALLWTKAGEPALPRTQWAEMLTNCAKGTGLLEKPRGFTCCFLLC